MKRLHLWISTLHLNFVAWMWKRYNRKEMARRYPTVGDYVNKARADLEALGYQPPVPTAEAQEEALRAVNSMIDSWKLKRLDPPKYAMFAECAAPSLRDVSIENCTFTQKPGLFVSCTADCPPDYKDGSISMRFDRTRIRKSTSTL